ncbi:MAG: DUF4340 domain-containing protein [Bacteroidota bacterium]
MKRIKPVLLLFVALAALAAYLILTRTGSTLKGELKDFAYADTAAVTRIFMADKDGRRVTVDRQPGGVWTVNGKFTARKDAIDNLLNTIKSVEVKSPVGKNLYNNTMKLMAAKSVKVEVYAGAEAVKVYYVGHPTMDNLGTFMYLEGSTVPFITHIPGFNGFLSTRYFASEAEWRDKSVFRLDPRSITRVGITEFLSPSRSFTLNRQADSSYVLVKTADNQPVLPLEINKVRAFLYAFSETYFERIDLDISPQRRDSVLRAGPFAEIQVVTDAGKELKLTCYRKPVTSQSRLQIDFTGEDLPFDYDRFYALVQGDSTLLVCQYFHFDRIFKDPVNFSPGPDRTPAQSRF